MSTLEELAAERGIVIPEGYTLKTLGDQCRSCGAEISWFLTKAGKTAPLNPDGTSHFSTCPQAASWRKRA